MGNENPMGKGPDGALGFLRLWGTFTIAPCLQLPGPAQLLKNRKGFWRWQDQAPTVGEHWDFNTHHNTRDNRKGRQKRNITFYRNILQFKNAQLVVWKVRLCVSAQYSVVRPSGVVL